MSDPIRCPYCKTKMNEVPLGPVVIDVCPQCEARWFDRTELAAASNHLAGVGAAQFGAAVPGGKGPRLRCPRDGEERAVFPYVAWGVPFGRCTYCRGMLFSGAEWRALEKALVTGAIPHHWGSEKVSPLEILELLAELGNLFIN